MKVLMFAWEFSSNISGGVGTACYNEFNDFVIRLNLAANPMQFKGYRDQNENLISII